jgi:hypothetical protein
VEHCCCCLPRQDHVAGAAAAAAAAAAILTFLQQLSDDWEPSPGWDEEILRAVAEAGASVDDEWVLQVTCDV